MVVLLKKYRLKFLFLGFIVILVSYKTIHRDSITIHNASNGDEFKIYSIYWLSAEPESYLFNWSFAPFTYYYMLTEKYGEYSWTLKKDDYVSIHINSDEKKTYYEPILQWNSEHEQDNERDLPLNSLYFEQENSNFCSLDVYLNENREIVKKEYKKNRFLWWCY